MSEDRLKYFVNKGRLFANDGRDNTDLGGAIIVHRYLTNVDNDEVHIQLKFKDNKRAVIKALKRDKITPQGVASLTRYGADSWPEVAEHYTQYVREKLETKERSYEHSNVGWGEYDGVEFFKLYNAVGFDSKYDEVKYNLKPEGTLEAWLECIEKEVRGKPWLEFALAAGFSAPLVKIIGDYAHMDSLFINFYGPSTTGKTLATRLAISPFGFADKKGNGLLQLWYGTDAGILESMKGNYGVPFAIDDTSTQQDDKDFTQFIYLICGGKEKAALNPDGSKRGQEEWMTTVFSSSEVSILQNTDQRSGLRVRFFEVHEPNITTSAQNAEAIEKAILSNYGHAGSVYVEYLLKLGKDEICKRWEETRAELLLGMAEDSFTKRISAKLAIVRLAGELANEALNLGLDIGLLSKSLWHLEQKSLTTRDVGDRAYQYMMEYFASNPSKFIKDKDDKKGFGEVIGKYIQKNGSIIEIRIPCDKFRKLLQKEKFDLDQVIEQWKAKGLLNHDKGKNTLNRVFTTGASKLYQYAIKVKDITDPVVDGQVDKVAEQDTQDYNDLARRQQIEQERRFDEREQAEMQVEYQMEQQRVKPGTGTAKRKVISIRRSTDNTVSHQDEMDLFCSEDIG